MHLKRLAANRLKIPSTNTLDVTSHQEKHSLHRSAMARTWYAGPPPEHIMPPSKNPNVTLFQQGDPPPYIMSDDTINTNNFGTADPSVLTKEIHLDKDIFANQSKLPQYSSKSKEQIAVASKGPNTSKPGEKMNTFAPSSPAPRPAPTAQMVPLPPNAAVTTTPTAMAARETSTTSLCDSSPGPMGILRSQAFFPATAPPSLPSPPVLPSSSPTCSSKKSLSKKFISKTPKITLAPAPATAPSAFKDPARAVHIRNTRLLSPVRQQTNGVKKRQHIRTSSPLISEVTPKSVPDEQRGRGRPRTRSEERPSRQNTQDRLPVRSSKPFPQIESSNQSNSSLVAPPAFALQQQQAVRTQQQPVTFSINGDLQPALCAEEPRLWPGRGDYVASLLQFNLKPDTIHSEPIKACTNYTAHKDPRKPHGHGVCTTCHQRSRRHLKATRPELFDSAWWPLCKACSDHELLHGDPKRKGCSCGKIYLCFSCETQWLERRNMKNSVEAEFRRRTFIGEGMDGDVKTVRMGWNCECGEEIGPNATLMKCIGCQGLHVGKIDPLEAMARAHSLTRTALAWT